MAEFLPNWDTHNVGSLRAFSRISLIAVDLDGTFLDPQNPQPPHTLESLRRRLSYYRYSVGLTIATGRALAGVQSILRTLRLRKGVPLILYNGSVVIRNKSLDIVLHKGISPKTLRKILSVTKRFPVRTYAYFFARPGENRLRMIEDLEHVLGWSEVGRPRLEFNGMRVEWKTDYVVRQESPASAVLVEATSGRRILASVANQLSKIDGINVTRSGPSFVEIRPVGSNKGTALAAVAADVGLSRENILALGDNDNDAEMLLWAGIGVAISGASDEALKSSDYICHHGVAQGAVEVLRLVKNARRYFSRSEQESVKARQGVHE